MTETLSRRQAIALGLVVFLGLALGAAGLFAVGDRQGLWEERFHLWARFPQVSGIEIGARVRVQGINAGQVEGIEQPPERGGDVLVRLRLDSTFRPLLARDARAEIVTEGLIGGKVIELHPGTPGLEAIEPGATIVGRSDQMMTELRKVASRSGELLTEIQSLSQQANGTLKEAQGLFQDLRQGEGNVGREIIGTLRQFQHTSESVGTGFDAMKSMPLVSRYVTANPTRLLIRPSVERHPFSFKERDLFEPGRAILTADGKKKLDALAAGELTRLKVTGSEVVIVAYTDGQPDERAAEVLTQEQADAVKTYLVDQHKVDRMGWWSWRTVTAVGMGTRPAPGGGSAVGPLPGRRIEVLVFAPYQSPESAKLTEAGK